MIRHECERCKGEDVPVRADCADRHLKAHKQACDGLYQVCLLTGYKVTVMGDYAWLAQAAHELVMADDRLRDQRQALMTLQWRRRMREQEARAADRKFITHAVLIFAGLMLLFGLAAAADGGLQSSTYHYVRE